MVLTVIKQQERRTHTHRQVSHTTDATVPVRHWHTTSSPYPDRHPPVPAHCIANSWTSQNTHYSFLEKMLGTTLV